MSNLQYKGRRDLYVPNGYGHITTSIYSVYETGSMYTGSFLYTGSPSYTTNNALIIEITRAGYSYLDRYYQNVYGNVTSWMHWEDPVTGLTTPRILGDDPVDAYFGPHYLVVDLNTDEVVDFLSNFNYFYAFNLRTYTTSNLAPIN